MENAITLTPSKAKAKVKRFVEESSYNYFSVFVVNRYSFLVFGTTKNAVVDMEQIEEREKQRCKELRISYPSHDKIEPKVRSSDMMSLFKEFLETFESDKIQVKIDKGQYCLLANRESRTVNAMLEEFREKSNERMERLEEERLAAEEARLTKNYPRHVIEPEEEDDDDIPEEERPLNLRKIHSKQRIGRDEARGRMDSLDWNDITNKIQNNLATLSDIAAEHGVSYAGLRYRLKRMGVL